MCPRWAGLGPRSSHEGTHVGPGFDPIPSPAATAGGALRGARSRLWRTEDWIAVVLGFLVITAVLLTFQWKVADLRNVVPTFRWTTDAQIALAHARTGPRRSITIAADADAKRQAQCRGARASGLKDALASQDRKQIESAAGKLAALGSRTIAGALGTEIRGHAAATTDKVFKRHQSAEGRYCRCRLRDRRRDRHRADRLACRAVPARAAGRVCARVRRALPRRQRALRRLGHRVRHFRAGLGLLIIATRSARRSGSSPRCRPSSSSRPASSSSARR